MEKRELTCINCPLGCALTVTLDGGEVVEVTGYTCPRGLNYAKKEVTAPARIVTSTVAVKGGALPVVPVKTASDIPKGLIFDCMSEINNVSAQAPVKQGDVLIRDVCGTGVDVIATRSVPAAG